MRIGIDISQVVYKGTGVSRFVEGLIDAICKYDTRHQWVFFYSGFGLQLDRETQRKIRSKKFKLVKLPIPTRILATLWNGFHTLPVTTFTGKLDWFITSDWTEPPAGCKKATVIHDLTVFRYPDTVDALILNTQRKRLRWVERESSLIFADSETTKNDIQKYLKTEAKIERIYPGVEIQHVSAPVVKQLVNGLKLEKNFVLSVGKLEPRKNIPRLIEAFHKANLPHTELVIVGGHGWGEEVKSQKNVRLLGYVDDQTLNALYQAALFFVFPSIWEGFGYPVVEAMKHGTPVAASHNSSLKELGNDATLQFDPLNIKDITHCIKLLGTNKKLRDELKRKGIKRAEDFSWQNYYNEMVQSLESF